MAGEADIQAVKEWFGKTWMSRLNDQENGPMVVVGQRLHEQDLSGHILELGGWTHLNLPEEFEPETKCETSIGWSDPRTVEGELLWPEKFPKEVLDKLKRGLGPVNYAAQYQQRPVPASGNVLNINHRRWFSTDETTGCYLLETPRGIKPVFKKDCWLFATVDLAVSEKQSADFTVLQAWAVTPFNDLLLLDVVRDHFTHPEQQAQIGMFHQRFGFQFIAVESVAYQLSLIQDLLNDGIPVKPYRPQTDKVTRASTVAIWYANGKVYHQKDMPWLYAFEKEIFTFPKAAKDDQMDCTSLAGIVVCNSQTPGVWDPNGATTLPDTTDSIEEILDATQIAEERRLAAEEEQAAIPLDPFSWLEQHGGWDD
jgi:predicted phage terminase large subunit-like protein